MQQPLAFDATREAVDLFSVAFPSWPKGRPNDEILYDTRYDQWADSLACLGVEFPVCRHVLLEPSSLRQDGMHLNPPHRNAPGFQIESVF